MSLADRLDQARRSQPEAPDGHDGPAGAKPAVVRVRDPFAAVKASVHQALLDSLGPQLYDPHLEQAELELRVRQTLQTAVSYTHLRAHETDSYLVCRLLLEKKKKRSEGPE